MVVNSQNGSQMSAVQQRRRAQAMVVVFVFMSVISLSAINLTVYAQNVHRIVIRNINHLIAWNGAEAGILRKLGEMTESHFQTGAPSTTGFGLTFPNTGIIGLTITDPVPTVTVTVTVVGSDPWTIESVVTNWR